MCHNQTVGLRYEGKHGPSRSRFDAFGGPPGGGWGGWFRAHKGWTTLLALLLVGGLATTGWLIYLSWDLPEVEVIREYQPSLVTRVYADDGQLIGQFYIERRIFAPLESIPLHLRNAFIAVEDARFYQHHGFNLYRIAAAFFTNLIHLEIRQGASTITQQLARSLFLTPERTIQRKLREILLALKIERLFTKDQILEMYLNQIYFGHGAYGVQAAAKTYFNKDVGALALPEAAFLASLPKAPTGYSPYNNPEKVKQRQGLVLRRMVEEGYLTEEEYLKAYAEDLFFEKLGEQEDIAPYFIETLRQSLFARYGETALYRGGLEVHTTLNVAMQQAANRAVRTGLAELDKRQGYREPIGRVETVDKTADQTPGAEAAGAVRPELKAGDRVEGTIVQVFSDRAVVTAGGVQGVLPLAEMLWARKRVAPDQPSGYVIIERPTAKDIVKVGDIVLLNVRKVDPNGGGTVFSLEQDPIVEGALLSIDPRTGTIKAMVGGYDFRRSEFNRATQARRQPGSAFKPIIYATAIEKGMMPSTLLVDAPIIYTDTALQKVWKPTNYEEKFYGMITMREALTNSRNVATIRLLERVGIGNVVDFAHRLGIQSPLTPDLSLALGSSSLTLMELTTTFGVFSNQGIRAEPYMIQSVRDSSGQVLESHEPRTTPVIPRSTAYLITNLLEDVVQRGTGQRARALGRPVAGKTGTTNDFTDAWFVGFTPNLVTGVWVGFDDQRSLGDREAGASVALPIWVTYMREALKGVPAAPFPIPSEIVYAPVDPKTGNLAPDGQNSNVEVFVRGTVPTEQSRPAPDPVDFFNLDRQS